MASTWAKKFGVHPKLQNKSGFTPINPTLPIGPPDKNKESQASKFEAFQKKELNDFTTQELIDLDATGTRKLKPSNLGGQIIPFLQQNNWYVGNRVAGNVPRVYPLYDIKRRPGTGLELWIGTNATVWRLMQPWNSKLKD